MAVTVYCFNCDYSFRVADGEPGIWWRGDCPRCGDLLSDEDFEAEKD